MRQTQIRDAAINARDCQKITAELYCFCYAGDLWGPLVLCLMLSATLSYRTEGDSKTIITSVFVIMWVGALVVYFNANFLGSEMYPFHNEGGCSKAPVCSDTACSPSTSPPSPCCSWNRGSRPSSNLQLSSPASFGPLYVRSVEYSFDCLRGRNDSRAEEKAGAVPHHPFLPFPQLVRADCVMACV